MSIIASMLAGLDAIALNLPQITDVLDGIFDPQETDFQYGEFVLAEPEYLSSAGETYKDNPANEIIGDPQGSMEHWHQQAHSKSCAICSQEFIIEDLLGLDYPEEYYVDISEARGWYDSSLDYSENDNEGGTNLNDVGNLLEEFGIQTKRHENGTMDDIINRLESGGNVIVGLDANEIWSGEIANDQWGDPGFGANHAVEVIGYDATNEMVILNDSGTPDGQGSMIPLDQFMDAWADSNNFMVEAWV